MSRGRVMVVDDDVDWLDTVSRWCTLAGFDVFTFPAAQPALKALEAQTYDVLLTDLMMPGISGIDLLGRAKQIGPHLPVVFMTGHPSADTAIQALAEGRAFHYLIKPLKDLNDLTDVLSRAIDRSPDQVKDAVPSGANPLHSLLSKREFEIASLLLGGLNPKEIGVQIGMAEDSIRNVLSKIYKKIGARDRVHAVLLLLGSGRKTP